MSLIENLNQRPADAIAEDIQIFGHDTLIFKKKSETEDYAIINGSKFFNPADKKSEILKTNDFPLENGRVAKILGLNIIHNIVPADMSQLTPFEIGSLLKVNIEDTDYSSIPLQFLLRYSRVPVGKRTMNGNIINQVQNLSSDPGVPASNEIWYNTTTKQLKYKPASSSPILIDYATTEIDKLTEKGGSYSMLPRPIDPPHIGKIRFDFVSGVPSLQTNSVEKYGHRFGAGVIDNVDSPVFFIQLQYFGVLIRTKTR